MEINLFVSFISGLIVGLSPCIFLIISAFGTTLILSEEKSNFLKIVGGLLSGIILAYILITILFFYLIEVFLRFYTFIRYIFAGILIVIGIWQIIESTKEKSLIYQTPSKVKLLLKNFIEKNSGFYAFMVGIIFILIKLPCMGAIYSALIYNFYSNPYFFFCLILYFIGMLIPILILLILLRLGLESSEINEMRLKYRPYLRIISGLTLILLSIYLVLT